MPGRLNSCFSPVVMYLYKTSAYSMGVLPLFMKKSFLQLNISMALSKQYLRSSILLAGEPLSTALVKPPFIRERICAF